MIFLFIYKYQFSRRSKTGPKNRNVIKQSQRQILYRARGFSDLEILFSRPPLLYNTGIVHRIFTVVSTVMNECHLSIYSTELEA